jgi:hypothetical protein
MQLPFAMGLLRFLVSVKRDVSAEAFPERESFNKSLRGGASLRV